MFNGRGQPFFFLGDFDLAFSNFILLIPHAVSGRSSVTKSSVYISPCPLEKVPCTGAVGSVPKVVFV